MKIRVVKVVPNLAHCRTVYLSCVSNNMLFISEINAVKHFPCHRKLSPQEL